MTSQTPYLVTLREFINNEINQPTPTRDAISKLIESIPQGNGNRHLPGLVSAQAALRSALEEDLNNQRQRVGQEICGLLEDLKIPLPNPPRPAAKPRRTTTADAIKIIRERLEQAGQTPKSRSELSNESGLNPSTTKRALALLVKDGTAEANKNARVHMYKIRKVSTGMHSEK